MTTRRITNTRAAPPMDDKLGAVIAAVEAAGVSREDRAAIIGAALELAADVGRYTVSLTAIGLADKKVRQTKAASAGRARKTRQWQTIAKRLAAKHPGKSGRGIVQSTIFWAAFEAECRANAIDPPSRSTVRKELG